MPLSPFSGLSLQSVCFVAMSCAATLADDVPSGRAAAPNLVGTKAGQVCDDNGLKMKLIWCPAGAFTMGSPKEEKGRSDFEAQVQVTLTEGFWLGQHEVTQSEWQRVMQSAPWSGKDFVKEGRDYPASYVSWDDVTRFCERFTETERDAGRLPVGWKYMLPTEAQWEYACRAGTKSRFSFGDDESDLTEYGWFLKNGWEAGEKYAHQVAQKKANAWGLYDMHGNVFELCRDDYTRELPGGTNPEVAAGGSHRVSRGGCWNTQAVFCRAALRAKSSPEYRKSNLGFRVALSRSAK